MAVGILVRPDCARKEIRERLLLRLKSRRVCQKTAFPGRLPHQANSDVLCLPFCDLPDLDFDLFECLKHPRIIVAPEKRPHTFCAAHRFRAALVRGCGQASALQTVEPVTYRCGTRRVCQARSAGAERDTRARPHAVAPMNCVPEDSRRRSTCTGRTHSPRARADGHQTPSSTVAVRAPSPS